MQYITAQQAAETWGVSLRYVQRLLCDERVAGARKYGRAWMIPADAEKPPDPRRERKQPREKRAAYLFLTSADLPKNRPDGVLYALDESFRPLAAADVAFRRGDPAPAKALWRETPREDKTKLSAASLATAAAISSGDYALYNEILHFWRMQSAKTENRRDRALLSLPETLAAVSMSAPEMTPDWLKSCDFSLFPHALRPFLLFLHAMHLRNVGEYAQMLGVAKAALLLIERPATFTWLDVYLLVLCAVAANALGDAEQTGRYLDSALALGMPAGFIAPFADYLGDFGGIIESRIMRSDPERVKPVVALWNTSFKNWMRFHNSFAKDNITTVLSPREYQTAHLIAHGETYAGTARRMHLSVSRIKDILTNVYAKLYIQNKQDLTKFVL